MSKKITGTIVFGMALSSLVHAETQDITEVDYSKADYKQLGEFQASEEKEEMQSITEAPASEALPDQSPTLEENQQSSEKLLDDYTPPLFEQTATSEEESPATDGLLEQ
jgi:hypothetical protein